jgi:hypothetical protein
VQTQVKALLNVRQALFDCFGTYPSANAMPYIYALERSTAKGNAIGAGLTIQDKVSISSDAAFVCTYITGSSTGDYLIQARLDASDRILMNIPVHSSTIVGTGEQQFKLPKPLLIPANATLSLDLTDLSGSANEVYLSLCGYKVYR